ncbi:hypothetical protein LIER_02809 [Lithospermum erythrorhizon]|uniref:SNF2 N-terminal domain-containing protein n=1 Tax=Lithospermum erythrorhizon TaxID=34254 RepID=A0AAV3NSB0_LITER
MSDSTTTVSISKSVGWFHGPGRLKGYEKISDKGKSILLTTYDTVRNSLYLCGDDECTIKFDYMFADVEFWALFDLCVPGLLHDKKWFRDHIETPILAGLDTNASRRVKIVGESATKEMNQLTKPFMLQRMKNDVFIPNDTTGSGELPPKHDLIIWLKLTNCQGYLKLCMRRKNPWGGSGSTMISLTSDGEAIRRLQE